MDRDDERVALARLEADGFDQNAGHLRAVVRLPRDLLFFAERDVALDPRVRVGDLRPLRAVVDVAQRGDAVIRRRRVRVGVRDQEAPGLVVARHRDRAFDVGHLLRLPARDGEGKELRRRANAGAEVDRVAVRRPERAFDPFPAATAATAAAGADVEVDVAAEFPQRLAGLVDVPNVHALVVHVLEVVRRRKREELAVRREEHGPSPMSVFFVRRSMLPVATFSRRRSA